MSYHCIIDYKQVVNTTIHTLMNNHHQPPAFVVRTRDLESQNFIEISKFLLRFQDFISRFQDFQKLGVGLGT